MRLFEVENHPDMPRITGAIEIAANIAANAFIALVLIGRIILGLAIRVPRETSAPTAASRLPGHYAPAL